MKYTLNRFSRIRVEDPPVCDLLLERRTYRLPSARLLAPLLASRDELDRDGLLRRFAGALPGHDPAQVSALVDELIERRILQPADEDHPALAEAVRWHEHGWTDALIYHCLSEQIPRSDVPGPGYVAPAESLRRELDDGGPPEFWRTWECPYAPLPAASPAPDRDLAEVLLSRRTHRPWTGAKFIDADLSRVLADANQPLVELRTKAAAGYRSNPAALLANAYGDVESYVAVHDVPGLDPGLYHYDPLGHRLGRLRAGDLREELQATFVGQASAGGGRCAVLISAVWSRSMLKYRDNPRAYRSLMTVIGQFGQRYLVGFTGFGLTTFPTPAHTPELADRLLGTERLEESVIYLLAAG